VTTATTEIYPTPSVLTIWPPDTKSEQEMPFNNYWTEYFRRNTPEFNITALPLSPETAFKRPQNTRVSESDIDNILPTAIPSPRVSPKNLRLIAFLDRWATEPDNLGEGFWNQFCDDLEKNGFSI